MDACPAGTFSDASTSVCTPCSSDCAGCSGPTSTDCTSCAADVPFLYAGSCVVACPRSTFQSGADSCEACDASCGTQCNGTAPTDCLTCPASRPHLDGGRCTCNSGYLATADSCTQIDECATGTHDCFDVNYCTDVAGSYQCSCPPGYSGDGVTCEEIDECVTGAHTCSEHATCTNLVGATTSNGYTCACFKAGYWGNGFYCADVDECSLAEALPTASPHTCSPNTQCRNTDGAYECECKSDFRRPGRKGYRPVNNSGVEASQYWNSFVCEDIDECLEGLDDCDKRNGTVEGNFVEDRGICNNENGSFTCTCLGDYGGDGVTCHAPPRPSPPNSRRVHGV